jgi:hypothetical protein
VQAEILHTLQNQWPTSGPLEGFGLFGVNQEADIGGGTLEDHFVVCVLQS